MVLMGVLCSSGKIQVGDVLISVGGQSMDGLDLADAIDAIRGV